MAQALGQMPNAPLIYVLAQIRFTHVPRMDKRWEDFHEKIYESYPKAEAERIDQFAFKRGQPAFEDSIQRWHLTNEARTTGLILDAGMLVFHTTSYAASETFFAELHDVLKALETILPDKGVSTSRLGLRYVDLLFQESGLSVEKQVIDSLRVPDLPNIGVSQKMEQIITYKTSINGKLVIRYRQSTKPDVLPADIFPNKLLPAPRLARERIENSMVGLLDYDHYIEKEVSFDSDFVIKSFQDLHGATSVAFKATTTESAQNEWKKEVL